MKLKFGLKWESRKGKFWLLECAEHGQWISDGKLTVPKIALAENYDLRALAQSTTFAHWEMLTPGEPLSRPGVVVRQDKECYEIEALVGNTRAVWCRPQMLGNAIAFTWRQLEHGPSVVLCWASGVSWVTTPMNDKAQAAAENKLREVLRLPVEAPEAPEDAAL